MPTIYLNSLVENSLTVEDNLNDTYSKGIALDSLNYICKLSELYDAQSSEEQINMLNTIYIKQSVTFDENVPDNIAIFKKTVYFIPRHIQQSTDKDINEELQYTKKNNIAIEYDLVYSHNDVANDKILQYFKSDKQYVCNQLDKIPNVDYKFLECKSGCCRKSRYKIIIDILTNDYDLVLQQSLNVTEPSITKCDTVNMLTQACTIKSQVSMCEKELLRDCTRHDTDQILRTLQQFFKSNNTVDVVDTECTKNDLYDIKNIWDAYEKYWAKIMLCPVQSVSRDSDTHTLLSDITRIEDNFIRGEVKFRISKHTKNYVEITFTVHLFGEGINLLKKHVENKINNIKAQCDNNGLAFNCVEEKLCDKKILHKIIIVE